MSDAEDNEIGEPDTKGQKPQIIDDLFRDSRLKLDMIIELLSEKLLEQVKLLDLSNAEHLKNLESLEAHLERLVFIAQMNKAKTRDLMHLAPKKYRVLLSDEELRKKLRPVREGTQDEAREHNFPKRGPRGPRDDVAPPADGD